MRLFGVVGQDTGFKITNKSVSLSQKNYNMTYKFSIKLSGFRNPEVWRQIEIPASYTFFQFHEVLAIAFGKTHKIVTYNFSPTENKAKYRIVSVHLLFDDNLYAKTTFLSDIFKHPGQNFLYVSNFDETRTHHILLEKIDNKTITYAHCLSGEGAYPPEVCAGAEDYEEMKLALSDSNHAKHEIIRDWLEISENETWEEKYHFETSKVNEQLMMIDAEIKAFRNYTVVPHDTFDKMYGLTPAHWKVIDKKKDELNERERNNWDKINRELQKLVNDNPTIPHFKNTLAMAYRLQKNIALYLQMTQNLIAEFPNYVMARCGLINYYVGEKKLNMAKMLTGKSFDLNELYPNRNGNYTDIEIANYQIGVIRYLIQNDDIEEAQKHFDYLEYISPRARDLDVVRYPLILAVMGKSIKEEEKDIKVEVVPEKILSSDTKPDFENPLVNLLYRYNKTINRDILNQIILLPRESVIKDLEMILIDSVARIEYHKDHKDVNSSFAPLHALSLLSVMQAEEALDTLLKILRQAEDYYDFWFDDFFTAEFWQFIYRMGQNRLERLRDFIIEPNRYRYARTAVCTALKHIAYYQPERKEEVIKWYQETLQYMFDHQNDRDVFDHYVYRTLFGHIINIAGREHLALVLPLYDANLIEKRERLSEFDIKVRLSRPLSVSLFQTLYTSIDQYYEMWKSYFKTDSNYKELKKDDVKQTKPATKTGRNDPCPCGSGKKFKKCCGINE